MLAIVKSLMKFRVDVPGISFKIITDCNALTLMMNKRDLSVRVACWALFLEELTYEIPARPGTEIKHVDAISCNKVFLIGESNGSSLS